MRQIHKKNLQELHGGYWMNKQLGRAFQMFVWQLRQVSKCKDRGVACLICSNDLHQIYSIGINGGPKGLTPECLCSTGDKYSCIHAEANALIKLNTRAADKIMICSLAPCSQCASMIINEPGGFAEVWYIQTYHDSSGLELLKKAGIKTGFLDAEGNVWYELEK